MMRGKNSSSVDCHFGSTWWQKSCFPSGVVLGLTYWFVFERKLVESVMCHKAFAVGMFFEFC